MTDAAAQLGVSPRRVRAMLAANDLSGERVGTQWMVELSSLPSFGRRAGQPFSPRVAWAFIELVSGNVPDWVSASELSRLRARWRKLQADQDPIPIVRSTLARRAERSRWAAPEPQRIVADPRVVVSGVSDRRAGMSAAQFAEGYVQSLDLDDVVRKHMLVPARGPGNVILRAVDGPVSSPTPWLAVVADLADGNIRDNQQARLLFERETSGV